MRSPAPISVSRIFACCVGDTSSAVGAAPAPMAECVAIVPNSDDSGRTHLKCLPNQRRQFQPCAQWHYAGDHRSDGLSGDVGELSVNATPHQLPLWSTLLSCLRRHSLYQRWQCQWNSSLLLLGLSTCASGGAYRTIASCGLRSSAPAVCVAPAPVLEFSLFVCGERSSWRQLRSRVVVSCVLARCLSASATQQGKFEESSVMEHFLRALSPAATAVAAVMRRCVTLSAAVAISRDVAASSYSQTAVAAAGTLRKSSAFASLLLRELREMFPIVNFWQTAVASAVSCQHLWLHRISSCGDRSAC